MQISRPARIQATRFRFATCSRRYAIRRDMNDTGTSQVRADAAQRCVERAPFTPIDDSRKQKIEGTAREC